MEADCRMAEDLMVRSEIKYFSGSRIYSFSTAGCGVVL